ncbi:flagellar protein FlgN [Pseudogracilibacillus sp. ICA-222130]|uniref:flagellar protein FlgN n=1 Tax=Pseudogracilibacillus sp. ICA-222130 TaxID=3134655 RepID=UPI0030BAB90E
MNHLQKLLQAHEHLLSVSKEKTEIIKAGEVERLSNILMEERMHVQTIEQVEKKRLQVTNELYDQLQIKSKNPSLNELVTYIENDAEKTALLEDMTKLIDIITALKANESLNKQLIEQSMQFIQLSLHMMEPSMDRMNYGGEKQTSTHQTKRSMFDSKA